MATVTAEVEVYPYDGVVGFEAEQLTSWGWAPAMETTEVGTYPDYTASYEVPVTSTSNQIRVRWETEADEFTSWFEPTSIVLPLGDENIERITQAILQKATRILMMAEAPLGTWGEMTQFGMATVRPDFEISELLYGLHFRNWDVDLVDLVLPEDVIRQGLQVTDVDDFPTDRLPDVQRAIDAAVSWVAHNLLEGVGIA